MKLVDYETAQTLQELGYDGEYNLYVSDDGAYISRDLGCQVPAPRLDDVACWLRKHELYIGVSPKYVHGAGIMYYAEVHFKSEPRKIPESFTTNLHLDYEDALAKAVKKAIEILDTLKS